MGRTQSAPSPDTGVSNLALLRTAATAHAKFVLASRGSCLKLDGHSGRRQERGELPRRAGREATSCAAKDRRGQDGAWTGAADSGRCRADPPCGAAARRDGLCACARCACARARALCGAPRAGARSVARGCARPAAGGSNSRPRYHAPGASPRSSPVAVTAAFFWGGLTPPRGPGCVLQDANPGGCETPRRLPGACGRSGAHRVPAPSTSLACLESRERPARCASTARGARASAGPRADSGLIGGALLILQ